MALEHEDPELGKVRYCRGCGEDWPLDEEFWYFKVIPAGTVATAHGRTYVRHVEQRVPYAVCRACCVERNRIREQRHYETPEARRAARREQWRDSQRERRQRLKRNAYGPETVCRAEGAA